MNLNRESDVVRLANTLGICGHPRPADAIVEYCLGRVDGWIKEIGGVDSLSQLERLVCNKLRLKFEYIESDADYGRVLMAYLEKGEQVIQGLLDQLDSATFGAVFERRHYGSKDRDRYVAVIDCRGKKGRRRFFTKWHEIAHILTLKHQLELIFLRDTKVKKPEEQLMDLIAGRVGFYPAIFKRGFLAELNAYGRFDFGLVQRVRDNVCSEASYESALQACLNVCEIPCLLVRVSYGLSKAEQESVADPQTTFLPEKQPIPVLRAVSTQGNEAAQNSGLHLHRNMRVPPGSHLYRAFQEHGVHVDNSGKVRRESLSIWEHSDGSCLAAREVTIYTRMHGGTLLALLVDEREA
jgi:hypothetical protein